MKLTRVQSSRRAEAAEAEGADTYREVVHDQSMGGRYCGAGGLARSIDRYARGVATKSRIGGAGA